MSLYPHRLGPSPPTGACTQQAPEGVVLVANKPPAGAPARFSAVFPPPVPAETLPALTVREPLRTRQSPQHTHSES